MTENFLWHEISEQEKQAIREQAQSILDDFSKKLSKIDKKTSEIVIERDNCVRDESTGKPDDIDRKIMFDNSPDKNKDFIITEKKKW